MLVAEYSFWEVLWWMIAFFAFIVWFWLVITVFADIFRRHDIGGGMKTIWVIFVILFFYLGPLVYLLTQHKGMADRNMRQMENVQAQQAEYIKSVAGSGGAAAEIEKAKALLDSGAITQAEYDAIKAKALGS